MALAVIRARAAECSAPVLARDDAWTIEEATSGLVYNDAVGRVDLAWPSLAGRHQIDNAGLAVAAIRAAGLDIPPAALAHGLATAIWPGRLQRLHGRLAATLPPGWELWVDGGHNPGGGEAMAAHLANWADAPVHFIIGMKQAKDTVQSLRPILPLVTTLWAVAEPGQHLALPIADIIAASFGVARPGPTIAEAVAQLPPSPRARVVIWGSLYLAGEVLKADGTSTD